VVEPPSKQTSDYFKSMGHHYDDNDSRDDPRYPDRSGMNNARQEIARHELRKRIGAASDDKAETCFIMNQAQSRATLAMIGEREYQDKKWPGHRHTTLEWLIFMEDYIAEAKRAFSRRTDADALQLGNHTVRKIGAMALACMEQNGTVTRDEEGVRPVGFVAP
jgi:hypothetical protein